MMSANVFWWWGFLCAVAALNVLAWSLSAAALGRRQVLLSREVYASRRLQLLLSAGYVFGGAFRSVLPVYDVPRVCLFDTWLCTVVIGRTVATIAELCFVAQLALLLAEVARATHSKIAARVSEVLVPMIIVAETFSWYSVLTTANIGHVVEESLWALSAMLVVVSVLAIWPRCAKSLRPLLVTACVAGTAYVAFMLMVDVPMYWSRWLADEATGRVYLSAADGLNDISARWVVNHHWETWRDEVAWMSLYFSVAVWLSIALIHAPVIAGRLRNARSLAAE